MRRMMARVCASWLVLGASLIVTAGPAHAADTNPVDAAQTIEEIAAQLQRDPIFIQQSAGGGDVAAARALTHEVIDDLPYRVFVIAGKLPIEDSFEGPQTFAFALHRLIGGEAVYAVAGDRGTPKVVSFGASVPEPPRNYEDAQRVMKAKWERFPRDFEPREGDRPDWSAVRLTGLADVLIDLHGLDEQQLTDAEVDDLAGYRFLHVITEEPIPDAGDPTIGRQMMVGTLVGLLLLFWLPLVLKKVSARRGRRPVEMVGQSDWRVGAELEQAREQLSKKLAAIDPARVRRRDLYDTALVAKEAADTCADSARETDRLGALTLVRHGLHAVRRANSTRDYVAWRPCFINPLDGQATEVRQWVFGDAEVRVPLCRACALRLDRANPARPLLVRKGRRTVPYFERDDVWGRTGYGALVDDYPQTVLREGGAR